MRHPESGEVWRRGVARRSPQAHGAMIESGVPFDPRPEGGGIPGIEEERVEPQILQRIQSLETSLTRLSQVTDLVTEELHKTLLRLRAVEELLSRKGIVNRTEIEDTAEELRKVGVLGFTHPPRQGNFRRLRRGIPEES